MVWKAPPRWVPPAIVEFLMHQPTLVKQFCGAAGRADFVAGQSQRTACRHDRDVWITEDVLPRAQSQTRRFQSIVVKGPDVLFIKTIEANVVVEQEARVVRKNFKYTAALKLSRLVRGIVDPSFTNKERMTRRDGCEVLVRRQRVVNWASCQLSVEADF